MGNFQSIKKNSANLDKYHTGVVCNTFDENGYYRKPKQFTSLHLLLKCEEALVNIPFLHKCLQTFCRKTS